MRVLISTLLSLSILLTCIVVAVFVLPACSISVFTKKNLDGCFSGSIERVRRLNDLEEEIFQLEKKLLGITCPIKNAFEFENQQFSVSTFEQEGNTSKWSGPGWDIFLEQAILGQTVITGFQSPVDNTNPTGSAGDGNDPKAENYKFYADGSSLQLLSVGITTLNGGDVVHGPYIVSRSPVILAKDDQVSFKWRAVGGADAYDVFAYLLEVSTGHVAVLLDETGSGTVDTGWQTATTSISIPGQYKFVFLSGSFDMTFGHAAGASLYLDDIKVLNLPK